MRLLLSLKLIHRGALALLTLWKRLLGVWFASDQRNERIVAVIHLVPELQLWSLDAPRMDELVATNLLTN